MRPFALFISLFNVLEFFLKDEVVNGLAIFTDFINILVRS